MKKFIYETLIIVAIILVIATTLNFINNNSATSLTSKKGVSFIQMEENGKE